MNFRWTKVLFGKYFFIIVRLPPKYCPCSNVPFATLISHLAVWIKLNVAVILDASMYALMLLSFISTVDTLCRRMALKNKSLRLVAFLFGAVLCVLWGQDTFFALVFGTCFWFALVFVLNN